MQRLYPVPLGFFQKFLPARDEILKLSTLGAGKAFRTVAQVFEQFYSVEKYVPEAVDRWKTRSQFLADGGRGDCEDFTLAWMTTLAEYGHDLRRLELVAGSIEFRQLHAVLYVYPTVEAPTESATVLDCRARTPKPMAYAAHRKIFTPLYGLTTHGGRIFNP